MLLKRLALIFTLFLSGFFSSCRFQGGTSLGVRVFLNPYGEGDDIRTGDDFIIRIKGGSLSCRPSTADINTIKPFFRRQGLLKNENSAIFDILGLERETPDNAGDSASGVTVEDSREELKPIKEEVGDNWLKIGLTIENKSDYHLVVTDIAFKAEGRYREQIFPYQTNIPSGYCNSPSNALYFVPKNSRIEYKPHSKDILNNLTIYISGFPIIDRITGTGGGSGDNSAGNTFTSNPDVLRGCYISIPRYRVEMVLRGYFITDKGNNLRDFEYLNVFYTRSSNEC